MKQKFLITRRLAPAMAVLLLATAAWAAEPAEIKLLTVGNSFADNSTRYLEDFAKSAGRKLRLYKANLGAHSLQMHVGYLRAYDANPEDPKGSPYTGVANPATDSKPKLSLRKALELEKWDYVTIQQVSTLSYQSASFEPWASELIGYIHRYAPTAKVLGLETWTHREDSWMYQKLTTMERMHAAIQKAYAELSARHGIEILPVGDAFQAARGTPEWKFQYPDPNFDRATAKPDQLPEQKGSLNVGWKWEKDATTKEMKLVNDPAHCNAAGQYLATAVLYEALFGGVDKVTFCPPQLTAEQAASLREIARQTVADSPIGKMVAGRR